MRSAALVLAVAAVVRLAVVVWLSDTIPYTDYFYYDEAGRQQAADWRFLFSSETVRNYAKLNWWPPGYPLFLASVYTLFGPQFRVAVYLQCILGVATCALVMAIAARACGRRAGLAAGWILALDPTYVFTTNLLASENLFAPLLALGLWLAGAARTTRERIGAGAVFGAATLVRASGLCLPFVVAAWMWRRRAVAGARRAAAGALLLGAALVIAPWTLRNAIVAGSPALVCFGGGLNFYFGHNDGPLGYRELAGTPLAGLGDARAIDRRGYRLGFETLRRNPLGFASRGVRKIGSLFAPPTYALHQNSAILLPDPVAQPELAPEAAAKRSRQAAKDALLHGPLAWLAAVHMYALTAAALGVLVWRRGRLPDEIQLAAWVGAAWIAVHIVFWAQPRFRYPLDIPMALVAAAGLGAAAVSGSRPAAAGRRG